MTPWAVSIGAAVASFLLLVVVLELIRSRRLRERYALLWLLTGAVLLALSLWRDGLNTIAGWLEFWRMSAVSCSRALAENVAPPTPLMIGNSAQTMSPFLSARL